jgi:hypothetical protein
MDAASSLRWHDHREVFGCKVSAFFFDPQTADAEGDFVRRMLPVFTTARPRVVVADAERRDFQAGRLKARPDAVLAHGAGLLCLEYKTQSGRMHQIERWQREIPCSAMLQVLAASVAVAAENGRPVVPLLRCHNALYLIAPSEQLITYLVGQVEAAYAYWGNPNDHHVSATELAKHCEARVRRDFWVPDRINRASSAAGVARHEVMLRR